MRKLIILLSMFSLFITPLRTFGETNSNEIDISTSPNKTFFQLSNLKPGDTYSKEIVINNSGKQDFKYLFASRILTGSNKFYNQLRLKIYHENHIIFEGYLKEFERIKSRLLKSGQTELLTIFVEVPLELGNEYQGMVATEFEFIFYVEGTLGGILPVNGLNLPETGTNMFNILLTGAVLVLTGSTLQFFIKRRRKIEKYKRTMIRRIQ
jgi:LPXTG-motif cell wall-anchored protein